MMMTPMHGYTIFQEKMLQLFIKACMRKYKHKKNI